MTATDKPLVWLSGRIATPPLSTEARHKAGRLLRTLQRGNFLAFPDSRPMPSVGRRCHELRIGEMAGSWRIMYRIDHDAVVVVDAFFKKTRKTPQRIIDECRRRLRRYDDTSNEE